MTKTGAINQHFRAKCRPKKKKRKKEKKKAREPADVASARSPCLNTVRGILAPPSPSLSLFHENQANSDFSTRKKKKKERNWSDIENRLTALVNNLVDTEIS